jgi:hypothetical protein
MQTAYFRGLNVKNNLKQFILYLKTNVNMKNQLVVLCLTLSLFSLVSCSKNADSSSPTNTPVYLVKSISQQLIIKSALSSSITEYLY